MKRKSTTSTSPELFRALHSGSLDELSSLLREGGDPNAVDADGRTLLIHAVIDDQEGAVRELLARGALVNTRDRDSRTPLHFATQGYKPHLAKLLLQNGADAESRDKDGNTPLSDAVFYSRGRGALIKLLLAAGASPDRENDHGVSPRNLARSIANYDLEQFFGDSPAR